MYNNQSYDEYIRSILGYPMTNENIYQTNPYYEQYNMTYRQDYNNDDLESFYPEIYKIIYPMIRKACITNNNPLNRETIENMVDDIYFSVESDNVFNVNINLQNNTESLQNRSSKNIQKLEKQPVKENEKLENKAIVENRGEDRQFGNRNLRDLIKILLIRELLQNRRPNRPGMPPFLHNRQPFPGLDFPPGRPRGYDIYKN